MGEPNSRPKPSCVLLQPCSPADMISQCDVLHRPYYYMFYFEKVKDVDVSSSRWVSPHSNIRPHWSNVLLLKVGKAKDVETSQAAAGCQPS